MQLKRWWNRSKWRRRREREGGSEGDQKILIHKNYRTWWFQDGHRSQKCWRSRTKEMEIPQTTSSSSHVIYQCKRMHKEHNHVWCGRRNGDKSVAELIECCAQERSNNQLFHYIAQTLHLQVAMNEEVFDEWFVMKLWNTETDQQG